MEFEQGERIENGQFWYDPETWHRAGFVQKDLKEVDPGEFIRAIRAKFDDNMAPEVCLAGWHCLFLNGLEKLAEEFGKLMRAQWPDHGGFEHVIHVPSLVPSFLL